VGVTVTRAQRGREVSWRLRRARRPLCCPRESQPALPESGPGFSTPLPRREAAELTARSTAVARLPAERAARRALPAPTRTARPVLRAPRSWAHPMRELQARSIPAKATRTGLALRGDPMTARRSAAARRRRELERPSRSRRAPRAPGRRASELPTPEWAGSTKARSAWAKWVPRAQEPEARRRRVLPMPAPGRPVGAQVAARSKAPAHPRWARPLREVMQARASPSLARGPPERPGIPTSEEVPERRPEPAAGPGPRANPTSARGRQAERRVRPRRARWIRAWRARPPFGPSLGTGSAGRQWSGRRGLPGAPRQAEPRSMRRPRSGRPVKLGGLEVPPSCACVSGASSDRGRRRSGPPPPGLCLRIQLASGGEPPFRRFRRCISDSKQRRVAQKYGIRLRHLSVTRPAHEGYDPTVPSMTRRPDATPGTVTSASSE
jgi:hypothetical protein